jgi:hypothetical protein
MPRSVAVVLAALCTAFGLSVLALVLDRAVTGGSAEHLQARLDLRRGDGPPGVSAAARRAAASSEAGRLDGASPGPALDSRRRIGASLGLVGAGSEGIGTRRGATTAPGVTPPGKGAGGSGFAGAGSGSRAEVPGEGGADAYDGPRSVEEAVPPDVALLEEDLAGLVQSLRLVDPSVVAWRAERLVPEGSVPPGRLEEAREAAEQYEWGNAGIARSLGAAYEDPQDRRAAERLARTLAPTMDPERRRELLQGAITRLEDR